MRMRHPWLVSTAGLVGSWALRCWMATLRFQYRPLGPDLDPGRAGLPGRYIYAFWHEYLLLPVCRYARPDVHVLVSRHADGQLFAEVCGRLGIPLVRGSTSRGGVQAVRQLLRAGRQTHLALTPDGPRGPRRRVQPGLIYLAAKLGLPVVPVGFGLQHPWRFASWDGFALPRPGSRAACVTAAPIRVPVDADAGEREEYRLRVEEALDCVTLAAEDWAVSGTARHGGLSGNGRQDRPGPRRPLGKIRLSNLAAKA